LQVPVKGQGQNSLITWEILLPGFSAECHVSPFAYSSETSPLIIEGRGYCQLNGSQADTTITNCGYGFFEYSLLYHSHLVSLRLTMSRLGSGVAGIRGCCLTRKRHHIFLAHPRLSGARGQMVNLTLVMLSREYTV
jgi:hypothetical protein